MTELELLNVIAQGRTEFSRENSQDLEDIDVELRGLVDNGYLWKIVRAVGYSAAGANVSRVDVVGGLTPNGEKRRALLARQRASRNAESL